MTARQHDVLMAVRDACVRVDGPASALDVRLVLNDGMALFGVLRSLADAGRLDRSKTVGVFRYSLTDEGREALRLWAK